MKKSFSILLLIMLAISCQAKPNKDSLSNITDQTLTPLSNASKFILTSKILDEQRPIIVSLPVGYNESDANYSVLYLLDGLQNIWHTMGSIEVLTRTGGMPPVIVIGIESTDRVRDFTPTASADNPLSGGGPVFLDFIEQELMPYVESNYRTHPFRILEGHSFAGLFSAYVLMQKPELFDAYIIMSPALWWNNEETTAKAKSFFISNPDLEKTIFFGIGSLESGKENGMRKELTNFVEVLNDNKPDKTVFEHKEMENEGHMSSPLLSNYYGLKFIFSDMKFSENFTANYTNEEFFKLEEAL